MKSDIVSHSTSLQDYISLCLKYHNELVYALEKVAKSISQAKDPKEVVKDVNFLLEKIKGETLND